MLTAVKKIVRARKRPTEMDTTVAQALFDLEASAPAELKAELKSLQIICANEVEVEAGKKAIIVTIPYVQLKSFHKIQVKVVRELEKKFSGKHVIFTGKRTILPKPRSTRVYRPHNRSLTAVHEALLHDVTFPTDVVGQRIRGRVDGSKLRIVYLDPKDQQNVEPKLRTFAAAYFKLTGKKVSFEFPVVTK